MSQKAVSRKLLTQISEVFNSKGDRVAMLTQHLNRLLIDRVLTGGIHSANFIFVEWLPSSLSEEDIDELKANFEEAEWDLRVHFRTTKEDYLPGHMCHQYEFALFLP